MIWSKIWIPSQTALNSPVSRQALSMILLSSKPFQPLYEPLSYVESRLTQSYVRGMRSRTFQTGFSPFPGSDMSIFSSDRLLPLDRPRCSAYMYAESCAPQKKKQAIQHDPPLLLIFSFFSFAAAYL